ncbi:hypothetical protein [Streptomyces smaragdinus]|uniref:hypothetical protein n=1 Tax=Streptomyces smaragdinus TaxID=2585196 RepID=UPI0012959604|nr:hypothetical protein [Streptomyces smaragdinus]
MNSSHQYAGERIDVAPLTASTITDDQLDAIRAELQQYRSRDTAGELPPTAACDDGRQPIEPDRRCS